MDSIITFTCFYLCNSSLEAMTFMLFFRHSVLPKLICFVPFWFEGQNVRYGTKFRVSRVNNDRVLQIFYSNKRICADFLTEIFSSLINENSELIFLIQYTNFTKNFLFGINHVFYVTSLKIKFPIFPPSFSKQQINFTIARSESCVCVCCF